MRRAAGPPSVRPPRSQRAGRDCSRGRCAGAREHGAVGQPRRV